MYLYGKRSLKSIETDKKTEKLQRSGDFLLNASIYVSNPVFKPLLHTQQPLYMRNYCICLSCCRT